jgi:hypothetical protein
MEFSRGTKLIGSFNGKLSAGVDANEPIWRDSLYGYPLTRQ